MYEYNEYELKAKEIIKAKTVKYRNYLEVLTDEYINSECSPTRLKRLGIEIRKTTLVIEQINTFEYYYKLIRKIKEEQTT